MELIERIFRNRILSSTDKLAALSSFAFLFFALGASIYSGDIVHAIIVFLFMVLLFWISKKILKINKDRIMRQSQNH